MTLLGNSNAKIYYRIFPLEHIQWDLVEISNNTIYIKSKRDLTKGPNSKRHSKFWEFRSDGVFCNDSQEFVYSKVTHGVLQSLVKGVNAIITGFGQTGTGKTFTITGLHQSEQEFGFAPRIINDLFTMKQELPRNMRMNIQMSYTEFSKSYVADLLKDFPNAVDAWHVKNATKVKVSTKYEALKLLFKGEGRKSFVPNNPYLSNIATTVLTFYVTTADLDYTCPHKINSRLHIIDMAGVDSAGNTSSSNLKSALDIGRANIAKSYLEHFIMYLMENIPSHIQVKERTNPLIYFLGKDLSNSSLLRFVGHLRIKKEDLRITLSMLRFGQMAKGLKLMMKETEPEIDKEIKDQYLQNKIDHLLKEKMFNSVLLNQDLTRHLDKYRMEHITRTVDAYIHNRINEMDILNVAEATEVFKIFKNICHVTEEEKHKWQETDPRIRRDSKTSSKGSLRMDGLSKGKLLKKSKESISSQSRGHGRGHSHGRGHQTGNSESKSSSVPTKKSGGDKIATSTASVSTPPTHQSIQRSKPPKTSPSFEKNSSSEFIKRKSQRSISSLNQPQKIKHFPEASCLPDILPEYEDAWNAFTNDSKSKYKLHLDAFKANENELKKIYMEYLEEMETLKMLKELVERRKDEVTEARMFQEFFASTKSNDGLDTEKACMENLRISQVKLLAQKELVLKLQSEIKICLNNRREIRQNLRQHFENYSKINFNIPVSALEEEDVILREEKLEGTKTEDEQKDEEELKCIEKPTAAMILEKLQKLMRKELNKSLKLKEARNRKWKNF